MDWVLAIFALGFLIVVHEAGHYVVARWCRMRVERFSIGFGPGIISRRSKKTGTLFQITPIPLGGFVEIRGMNIAEEVDPDDAAAYPNRPAWQRFVTIFAGPATNYLSAIILAFALYACHGMRSYERYWVVDKLSPGFDAADKLAKNDRILAVDGVMVYQRSPRGETIAVSELVNCPTPASAADATRAGNLVTRWVDAQNRGDLAAYQTLYAKSFTDRAGWVKATTAMFAAPRQVSAGNVAVTSDGSLVTVELDQDRVPKQLVLDRSDGWRIASEERLASRHRACSAGKPMAVRVRRAGAEVETTITPTATTPFLAVPIDEVSMHRLGVELAVEADTIEVGPLKAAGAAITYPVAQTKLILAGLKDVVTGKEPLDPGGAVRITAEFKKAFEAGWVVGIQLLMMLSVYIGMFNLFPLPALDGGRLVFLVYEMVTRRRANPRIESTVHMVGILLLLVIMVLVTFRDCRGLFIGGS